MQAFTVVLLSTVVSTVGLVGMLLPDDERMAIYAVLGALALGGGLLVALADHRIGLSLTQLVHSGTELRQSAAERAADLARLNRELRHRDRERANLFATMSHELRTPLNAIIGHSRLLLDGLDGVLTDEQQADVRQIHDGGLGLLRIVNGALDYARLEAGASTLEREPVQVWTVVEEVIALLNPLAETKGLSLASTVSPALPPVLADEARLRQVLVNLVGNAVKFTQCGGVELDADVVDTFVVVSVKDSGVGIAPDQRERIFEPFGQARPATAQDEAGTGLGLTIARRLTELMSGRVWLESEVGRGSTFFLALEKSESLPSGYVSRPNGGGVSRDYGILLLADERRGPDLAASLEEQGLSVRRACGPDWSGQVRSGTAQLVLSDLSLPRAEAWRGLADVCASADRQPLRLGLIGTTVADDVVVGNVHVFADLHVYRDEELQARLTQLLPAEPDDALGQVLVVGPDGAWRRRVAMTAQAHGYCVQESVTGDAAVIVARRVPIAAIVVNLMVSSPGVPEVLVELHAAVGRRPCPMVVAAPPALTPSELRDLHLGALSWIVADACPLPQLAQEVAGQLAATRLAPAPRAAAGRR